MPGTPFLNDTWNGDSKMKENIRNNVWSHSVLLELNGNDNRHICC